MKSSSLRHPLLGLAAFCALAAPVNAGTLLRYDFNRPGQWPGVATKSAGTVDVQASKDASGAAVLTVARGEPAVLTSGLLAVKTLETNLGKLTLNFDHSNSVNQPVSLRVESYDAAKNRSGGLETTIYPATADFFQRAAIDLSAMKLPICADAVSGCAGQQLILAEAGADLRRCYFSHIEATFGWSGRTVEQEIEYLQGVMEKGSTLSFDNFGNWNHTKPQDLARIIQELARRGYADRMVATMDVTWSFENGHMKILWEDTNLNGKDRTYAYLLDTAVPWMHANGIPREVTDKFIIDNPRRIFTQPVS